MKNNIKKYKLEKEAHEKRITEHSENIHNNTLNQTSKIIKELVEERHRKGMTQKDVADITGLLPSNIARFEAGTRIPTLIVLQKYASAVGKKIELKICEE